MPSLLSPFAFFTHKNGFHFYNHLQYLRQSRFTRLVGNKNLRSILRPHCSRYRPLQLHLLKQIHEHLPYSSPDFLPGHLKRRDDRPPVVFLRELFQVQFCSLLEIFRRLLHCPALADGAGLRALRYVQILLPIQHGQKRPHDLAYRTASLFGVIIPAEVSGRLLHYL